MEESIGVYRKSFIGFANRCVCVICTREQRRLTVNGNGTDFWFSSTVHTRSSSAGCAVVTVGFGLIERTKTVKVNHGRAEAVAEWNVADAGASRDCDSEIESESGCARESRTWHHVSNGSSSSSAYGGQRWGEGEVGVVWWGVGWEGEFAATVAWLLIEATHANFRRQLFQLLRFRFPSQDWKKSSCASTEAAQLTSAAEKLWVRDTHTHTYTHLHSPRCGLQLRCVTLRYERATTATDDGGSNNDCALSAALR